ncbi:MAG: hypothetical protein ACLUNZ_00455 [Evtepia sp.]
MMKTQHAHLVALLVMLLVLVAYVALLNTINITHPLLLALPAAVVSILAAQQWSDYLTMKKAQRITPKLASVTYAYSSFTSIYLLKLTGSPLGTFPSVPPGRA